MPVFSFACPHCAAPLRLKDRHWIGRTIDCPDCGQPVAIREDSDSGVTGQCAMRPDPMPDATNRRPAHDNDAGPTEGRLRLARWLRTVTSPLAVAWIVAAGLSVGLVGWLVGSPAAQPRQAPDASTNKPAAQATVDNTALPEGDEETLLPGRAGGRMQPERDQSEGARRETGSEPDDEPVQDDGSMPDGPLTAQRPDRTAQTPGPQPGDARSVVPVEPSPDDHGPNGPPSENPFGVVEIAPEVAGPGDRPIEVPLFKEPAPADIEAALNQPIARFDQSAPVPARQLLRSIEEMAAVEIETLDLAEEARSRLDRPVRLALTQTSVGEILAAVLGQLDLSYEVHRNRIIVRVPADAD